LNIPDSIASNLKAKVSDFIAQNDWHLPDVLQTTFPTLHLLVRQVIIPFDPGEDSLTWLSNDSGDFSHKDAFKFKSQNHPQLQWAKAVWSVDIPPSNSLVVWRFMLGKLPTDDNLMLRGCALPSVCNLCLNHFETSFHIFFDCPYAVNIWTWFAETISLNLNFNSLEDVWLLCDRNWKPRCKVVIQAALVNIFSTIWFVRNQARFNNRLVHWKNSISIICSNVSLSGNKTKQIFRSSMSDFSILKKFKVSIHPPKAPSVVEVIWYPPTLNWLKCNTDGAATSFASACGGVFRDHNADFVASFSECLGNTSSLIAELSGLMRAIELAKDNNWLNLWIETDSSLAVLAFKSSSSIIPWTLRNRWLNCMKLAASMNIIVTHVYREDNVTADLLANLGLNLTTLLFMTDPPSCIIDSLSKNKLGIPNFRFVD
jgi:ribonuclease HI